jgi:hypothetical protein
VRPRSRAGRRYDPKSAITPITVASVAARFSAPFGRPRNLIHSSARHPSRHSHCGDRCHPHQRVSVAGSGHIHTRFQVPVGRALSTEGARLSNPPLASAWPRTRSWTREPAGHRLGDEGVVRAQLWRRLRSGASKSRIPGLCLGAQRAFSKRTLRNLTHRGNACTSCRCRMGRDRCGPHRPRPRGIGSGMTARIHGRRSQAAHEPRAGTRSGRGRGTRSV